MVVRMTNLLQKAFALARSLPDTEQDALAALIIEEMESDRRWDELFAKSQDKLEALADEALEEHARGETRPFDSSVLGDEE